MLNEGMDFQTQLKSRLYKFVKDQQNILTHSSSTADITIALQNIYFLTTPISGCCLSDAFAEFKIVDVQKEFKKSLYEHVLEFLLKTLTVEWAQLALLGENRKIFDELFTCGASPLSALCVIGHGITYNGPGYRLNNCANLIESYLKKDQLQLLLIEQCNSTSGDVSKSVSSYRMSTWEDVVNILATLPERITNKLQRETSVIFYPDKYFPLVCNSMLAALTQVKDNLVSGTECSVQFLSHLLGKLCLCGHGGLVWNTLLPPLLTHAQYDYVWCRVCERLLMGVTDRCMESVLEPLLHKIPWYGYVAKFVGHGVLNNRKVQFLLTNKLIFLRCFQNELVLKNIIGYLASSGSLKHLCTQLLLKLLDVWGDSGAVKHTPYEQHLYITKAILICVAFIKPADLQQLKSEILNKLMSGVQVHLDCSSYNVRRLGMLTAEALTQRLNINDQKLKFEYTEDDETAHLAGLLTIPEDPGIHKLQSEMHTLAVHASQHEESRVKPVAMETTDLVREIEQHSDLDSDDDLEPYDLSNDVKVTKEKPPVYLRDCMEGLISPENPDKVEQCLQVAEKLIRQHPESAIEISVEFSKILVNLQDNFSLPEFNAWRHGAMLALLVVAPKQVSQYLINQVYERNYNIMQRLDILQALADAAKELSSAEPEKPLKASTSLIRPIDDKGRGLVQPIKDEGRVNESEDWRKIVEERIESKTRRFGKGRQHAEKEAVASRFASVAGCFFFPLLKSFDRVQSHLDMLGDDHMVLSRLIHTLGVIMYAAQHAPICSKMAQSMFEFIWAVRYHPQAFTRQAVLFAVCMVILAVPSHTLVADLSSHIYELKLWLQDVVEKDSSNECKKMAVQALVLLENSLKQEFGGDHG